MIGRNNPLNIRYSPLNKWKGQSGYTRGFCNFRSLEFGIRCAAYLLIVSYRSKGFKMYAQLIQRFAPPSENNTVNYVKYVCDKCMVFPFDEPVTIEDFATLIYYMWCFEQGKTPALSIADIEEIIAKFDFLDSNVNINRNS